MHSQFAIGKLKIPCIQKKPTTDLTFFHRLSSDSLYSARQQVYNSQVKKKIQTFYDSSFNSFSLIKMWVIVLFLQILFYVIVAKRSSVLSAKPVSCLDKSLRYWLYYSFICISIYCHIWFLFLTRYKTPPSPKMMIQSQVSILSIDSISSSRSELSSDIYLSHEWQDDRCKWNTSGSGIEKIIFRQACRFFIRTNSRFSIVQELSRSFSHQF